MYAHDSLMLTFSENNDTIPGIHVWKLIPLVLYLIIIFTTSIIRAY